MKITTEMIGPLKGGPCYENFTPISYCEIIFSMVSFSTRSNIEHFLVLNGIHTLRKTRFICENFK
jgi:hypothetical protein